MANIQAYKPYGTAIVAELLIITDTITCPPAGKPVTTQKVLLPTNNPVLALRTPRMQDIA